MFDFTFTFCENFTLQQIVRIKAKERISKRVFQENKSHQIFPKTNISYPLIRTRTSAYHGGRNEFDVLCFLETPVLRFTLLPCYRRNIPRNTIVRLPNLKSGDSQGAGNISIILWWQVSLQLWHSVQTTIPTNQYKALRLSNNRVNKMVIYINNKMVWVYHYLKT